MSLQGQKNVNTKYTRLIKNKLNHTTNFINYAIDLIYNLIIPLYFVSEEYCGISVSVRGVP